MDIYEVVEAQRKALLAREYKTVRDILFAYQSSEKAIGNAIKKVQSKIAKAQQTGTPISLSWLYQETRLENLLHEVQLQLDEFSKDAVQFLKKAQKDTYELGAVHALRLGEMSVLGEFSGLNPGAFANAQAFLSANSPLTTIFEGLGAKAVAEMREVFAKAVSQGWNPRKTGFYAHKRIEGLTKNRAILIARTEQIRAYRTANTQVFKQNSDVLRGWRWTCAKTAGTCALCLGMDGTIFPADQTLSSHPACRCTMLPLPNTDFGGPEPSSGEEFFEKLTPEEQDQKLGKTKGKLYRDGRMTLRDNIEFEDHPDWGRQPRPRTIKDLKTRHASQALPSQLGPVNLSNFEPIPATKLSDILDLHERRAADPKLQALKAWEEAPGDARGRRTGLRAERPAYKKFAPKDLRASGLESVIQEVDIKDLIASTQYPADPWVRKYIENMGDGDDLPLIVRAGGKLYVHDGDSLARIEAKRLLGQEKTSVRLYDADNFVAKELTPVEKLKVELKDMGVKEVGALAPDLASEEEMLLWAKARIEASGVVPDKVLLGGSKTSVTNDGILVVGDNFKRPPYIISQAEKHDYVNEIFLDMRVGDPRLLAFKAQAAQVSTDGSEIVEAALLRFKMGYADNTYNTVIGEFGEKNMDLFSVRAFQNFNSAVEEATILYRRGEYRLGSLPEEVEKDLLAKLEKTIGKKPVKAAFNDSERVLGVQIGPQGGSNPGGLYMGRDGVKRYVKFYPQADRAETEVLANALYDALGIDAPKTMVFKHEGKSAFASEIVEGGKTLQELGGVSKISKDIVEQVLDGYVADALMANWDVVGMSADNIMVAGGKVYRIDNGGTFIFRAQGGDKADNILQQFEEWDSLGGTSAKGYAGQMKPFIQRLGGQGPQDIQPKLVEQGDKALKVLKKIGGKDPKAGWIKWIKTNSPSITDANAQRIANMMVARTKLLDEKLQWIKKAKTAKPVKPKKLPKALDGFLNLAEPKPIAPPGTSTAQYDAILRDYLGPAFKRMDKEAKAAARRHSGGTYNSEFNSPLRRDKAPSDLIQSLDRAVAANHEGAPDDVIVIRKVRDGADTLSHWHKFDDSKVGTVIADKGFMSTCVHDGVWSGNTVLRIIMRKGEKRFTAPGATASAGQHGSEHEFILGRHMPMLVRKVEHQGGQTILTVELLPEGFKLPEGTVIHYRRGPLERFRHLFAQAGEDVEPGIPHSTNPDSVDVFEWSPCSTCARKRRGASTCDAFPEAIPADILLGHQSHAKSYPGDLGLAYLQDDQSEPLKTISFKKSD